MPCGGGGGDVVDGGGNLKGRRQCGRATLPAPPLRSPSFPLTLSLLRLRGRRRTIVLFERAVLLPLLVALAALLLSTGTNNNNNAAVYAADAGEEFAAVATTPRATAELATLRFVHAVAIN